MEQIKVKEIAQYLYDAEKNKQAIPMVTETFNIDLTGSEAYDIQDELVKIKKETDGEIAAIKIGLTSEAKRKQLSVDNPVYGMLFDYMISKNNEDLSVNRFIHPKVEPEIAYVLKEDIQPSDKDITYEDVKNNIDYVMSAVEIVDSRYESFNFTFADVIADNSSCQGTIFSGIKQDPNEFDLAEEQVTVYINGEARAHGQGKDVANHPINAVVFVANAFAKRGRVLPAGVPIMTGGMTKAFQVKPGDQVKMTFDHFDSIEFNVVE